MTNSKLERGSKVGPWTLKNELGSGGNAVVWRATESERGGRAVALKILRKLSGTSSAYRRFRDEINALQMIGDYPGILVHIQHSLPENPTIDNPAWLAMPLAIPLKEIISKETSLDVIVGMVRDVARTLSFLAECNIHHRDIKPENLLSLEGRWVVGDFGLVDYPGKESLTSTHQKLGPVYYIAPEMLNAPDNADPAPCDVYSLAKTLWVLGTGQTYPLPGELRTDIPAALLSTYSSHPKARLLNKLLDASTRVDPKSRPTMSQVFDELNAWLQPPAEAGTTNDLSDLETRIRSATEPHQRREAQRQELVSQANSTLRDVRTMLQPMAQSIANVAPSQGRLNSNSTILQSFDSTSNRTNAELIWQDTACVTAANDSGVNPYPPYLWSGIGVQLYDDGMVRLVAAHLVGMSPIEAKVVWQERKLVYVGSAMEEQAKQDLSKGLTENLRVALESFAVLLESSSR